MWNRYTFEKDKTHYWKIGNTAIWVRKIEKEWLIASKYINETNGSSVYSDETENPEGPEGIKWHSVITDNSMLMHLLPAMPDRPVVVKPESVFKLLPNMNIQLYIHIPLWIQFYHGSVKKGSLIHELPSVGLSSTWFGDTDNGILSYTNPKVISTILDKNELHPYEAMCPVKITNNDSTTLNFQRLLINVELLNIYIDNNILFTSEIKVSFKGEKVVSDIQYSQSAPAFLENAKLLASPRNLERKNLLRKSFHFIKSLTDY